MFTWGSQRVFILYTDDADEHQVLFHCLDFWLLQYKVKASDSLDVSFFLND